MIELLSAAEVAREMGFSRQYVNQLIREGRLVGVRVGRNRVFERREVDRFAAERATRAALDDSGRMGLGQVPEQA